MKRLFLLIFVALFLVCLSASATTIDYNSWVVANGTNTGGVFTSTPLAGTFSIPEFNPALGTLNSVTLTYTFNYNTLNASIHNTGGSVAYYDFTGLFTSILTGSTVVGTPVFYSLPLYATGFHSLNPGVTDTLITNGSGSGSTGLTPTATSNFVGIGTLTYGLVVSNNTTGTLIGSLDWSQTAMAYGQLKVTYDYDPTGVPEPATMAFAGFGLLLFGFVGRRFVCR